MRRLFMALVGLALFLRSGGIASADEPPASALRSGIDKTFVDPKVRPQDDLFRHVNGKWLAESTIPADRPLDGAFYKLRDKSEADLRAIIEETAKNPGQPGSESRKVGDLFASFMDEARANELGLTPIKEDLAEIDAIHDKSGLIKSIARL